MLVVVEAPIALAITSIPNRVPTFSHIPSKYSLTISDAQRCAIATPISELTQMHGRLCRACQRLASGYRARDYRAESVIFGIKSYLILQHLSCRALDLKYLASRQIFTDGCDRPRTIYS